jgi:hypothetical protein
MSRAAFVRRRGVDGERVDAAFELTPKRFVDHAVALEPALPAERLRHNIHPEMSFPALPMPGMPGVLVGFIHHLEARGGESLGQLFRDEIAPCHGVRIAGARPAGQCRPRPRKRDIRVKPDKSSAAHPMPGLRVAELQGARDPSRAQGGGCASANIGGFASIMSASTTIRTISSPA